MYKKKLVPWMQLDRTWYEDKEFEDFLDHTDTFEPHMFKWLDRCSDGIWVTDHQGWFESPMDYDKYPFHRTLVGDRPACERNPQFWEITVYTSGRDISFGFGEISLGLDLEPERNYYRNRIVGQ